MLDSKGIQHEKTTAACMHAFDLSVSNSQYIMAGSDSSSSSPAPKEVMRNWAEIPPEIMSLIFTKVGVIDILKRAQFVCSEWRKLCKDPHLFRSIHIDGYSKYPKSMHNILKEAVTRSCGQLVDFSIQFGQDDFLQHIIANKCSLRRLRFKDCFSISDSTVIDMAKKLPLLEELEICDCLCFHHLEKVIKTFGRRCPLLKSFKLNYLGYGDYPQDPAKKACDKNALAIARTMPELRHLNLKGAHLTNKGLQAILKGCPHLNFLDLSKCTHLNYAAGCLSKMCVDRNIELRVSGKVASLLKLITRVQWEFSNFLELQHRIPNFERIEAGYDEELDEVSTMYTKALQQTLAQIQPHILNHLKKYEIP